MQQRTLLVLVLVLAGLAVGWAQEDDDAKDRLRDAKLYGCFNGHARTSSASSFRLPPQELLAALAFMDDQSCSALWKAAAMPAYGPLLFHARQWYLDDDDDTTTIVNGDSTHHKQDPFDAWRDCRLVVDATATATTTRTHLPILECDGRDTGAYVVIGTGPAGSVVAHQLTRILSRRATPATLVVLEAGPSPVTTKLHDTRSHAPYMEARNRRLTHDNSIFVRNARVLGGGSTVNLDLAFAPTLPRLQARINQWRRAGWINSALADTCIQNASDWIEAHLGTTPIDLDQALNHNNALLWHGAAHSASLVDAYAYRLNAQPSSSAAAAAADDSWTKRSAVDAFLLPTLKDANEGTLRVRPHIWTHTRVIHLSRRQRYVHHVVVECSVPDGHHGPPLRFLIRRPTTVVLAAGALGSAEVLLRSAHQRLFNPQVGRGLVLHPSLPLLAKFPRPIDAHTGLSTSVYAIPRNTSDTTFLFESMSADLVYVRRLFPLSPTQMADIARDVRYLGGFGVMLIDTSDETNRLVWNAATEQVELHYRLTTLDAAALRRAVAIAVRLLFQQGATQVFLPTSEALRAPTTEEYPMDTVVPLTHPDQIDAAMARWTLCPYQTALTSAHLQATNKLGHVVDARLRFLALDRYHHHSETRVRAIRNLFIVDGSVFPESIGANPMQAIYVMAKLFTDHILHEQVLQVARTEHIVLLRAIVADLKASSSTMGVRQFLSDVLCQIDAPSLLDLLHIGLDATQDVADPYAIAQARFHQTRPWYFPVLQLRAMLRQNRLLGKQLDMLWKTLAEQERIDTRLYSYASAYASCLEIGFPGRHISKHLLPPYTTQWAQGQRWVLWETTSTLQNWTWSERLQAWSMADGGRRGFDHQLPWTHYAPISETVVASESLDVIVILIGLHHVPPTRLASFCRSLYRMLRPGGRLIVREHDASTPYRYLQAQSAHTLFNLVASGDSADQDRAEFRNFQPLATWIALLTRADIGFHYDAVPILQDNDPTYNTLCSFERPFKQDSPSPQTPIPSSRKDTRDLTVTEWYSVQLADEYAAFIHHTPWYRFPYLATARTMWELTIASMRSTSSYDPSYLLMNAWVCTTTTVQHLALALLTWPFQLMYGGDHAAAEEDNVVAVHVRASHMVLRACTNAQSIVSLPRYTAFVEPFRTMCACLRQHDAASSIVTIHGHDRVLVQVRIDLADSLVMHRTHMIEVVHTWISPVDPTKRHLIARMHVRNLPDLLLDASSVIVKVYES
jgi:SAM-dependent methyltransferase